VTEGREETRAKFGEIITNSVFSDDSLQFTNTAFISDVFYVHWDRHISAQTLIVSQQLADPRMSSGEEIICLTRLSFPAQSRRTTNRKTPPSSSSRSATA
jgi:hypothetical protein